MIFYCEKALLLQAISTVSRAVSIKSSIPALEGILIEAGDQVSLTGYNLETGIRTLVPADVREEGRIVLTSRLFGDIIRRFPDDTVEFETEGNMVRLSCGKSKFNIIGIDAEEFPELPSVEEKNRILLEQRTLKSMISQTLFCVAITQARPIHTGSLFEVSKDAMLTIVSLDGFRLALRREHLLDRVGIPEISFVVPGASLSEVEKICADTSEPVECTPGSRHIMFRIGLTTLISRRLEGEFLNYRTSIPKDNPISIRVDRKGLMESVERVSLVITEQQKSAIRCKFGKDLLTISTMTAIGFAYDECATIGEGNDLEIGFNNRYLLDVLHAAPADVLCLEMNTPSFPCIIVPADGTDNFLYMVLPVRLKR